MGKADSDTKKGAVRRGGFIVGAALGVVAGLLLAPRSGREMRARLFGEGGLREQVERLRAAVGAGRESAADQSEALRRKIEETRERLRRQMAAEEEAGGGEAAGGDGEGETAAAGGEAAAGAE